MRERPRILIVTLYCGENEFEKCIESLKAQSYTDWQHKVFKYLPNKEANDTLYREFMSQIGEFDLFIRLDADMVFKDSEGLTKIVELFRSTPDLDHAELAVHDWFSDSLMMGIHIYTNRTRWAGNEDPLFVDYNPSIPGVKLLLRTYPAPIVDHCPDPSPFEAFHFGVHRALKAMQPDRMFDFDPFAAMHEWGYLRKTWNHFVRSGDRRLGLAVLGAECVMKGEVKQSQYDYSNKELPEVFTRRFSGLSSEELSGTLGLRWRIAALREARRMYKIGPRFMWAGFRELLRKMREHTGTKPL